ncbi:hypothetical protein AVEN_161030-1, partial [Araneus ventricosus]
LSSQRKATREQKQGCPLGSSSDPALWNLASNGILHHDWKSNVHLQAFADDFVFVVHSTPEQTSQILLRKH